MSFQLIDHGARRTVVNRPSALPHVPSVDYSPLMDLDGLTNIFQANLIHRLLVRNPDDIPQAGDPVDRTLFLRRVTEEALAVTR